MTIVGITAHLTSAGAIRGSGVVVTMSHLAASCLVTARPLLKTLPATRQSLAYLVESSYSIYIFLIFHC